MPPTTLTRRLYSLLSLQLLLLTGASAVLVEKVGLDGNATYGTVQDSNATVFACHYRLEAGETLDEVVWVLGGRLVHSYRPAVSSPAVAQVSDVSKFEHPQVRRSSAGIYSCTVRTKEGADSTAKYEFFVIDIPHSIYKSSSFDGKCGYKISLETPAAYPDMTAFCGVWVTRTSHSGGYWLEPPPKRTQTNEVADAGSLRTQSRLSFSTERGDFRKIFYDNELTAFRLEDATIFVDDMPEDSSIKCFTGFYKKSGTFLPFHSDEIWSSDSSKAKCSNSSLLQFTTQHVTMECTNCVDSCHWDLKPVISILPPRTATFRCSKNLESLTLRCHLSGWTLFVGGAFKETFQDDLLNFAEACEKAEVGVTRHPSLAAIPGPGTYERNGGLRRTGAGIIPILLALSCLALQLRPLV